MFVGYEICGKGSAVDDFLHAMWKTEHAKT